MSKPKPGQRITAAWASGLQGRNEQPIPPGGSRVSTGVIVPTGDLGPVNIIAKNLATQLDPWTLVGLDTASPAVTDDGRLILQVTASRSKLVASTGASTVPANGQFVPLLFSLSPVRVLANPDDYWAEGIPCGKDPASNRLSSREGGLLCVKVPDANDYAWVVSDLNAIWTGALVGSVPAAMDPINPGVNGLVAVIKAGSLTDQRLDLCSSSDVSIDSGVIVTVGYTDRWSLLWANCGPTPAAEGLDPVPTPDPVPGD